MTRTNAKHVAALILLGGLSLGTVACSTSPGNDEKAATAAVETTEAVPQVDLTGNWVQVNAQSETVQTATITEGSIEVYWVTPDMKSLYWAGTVVTPADSSQSFTWDSVNDTSKTASALMASGDETKAFAYENGELSYEVTALGQTVTVRLARE